MEQHNIDSRFKKGLENLNRQPSPDAWARLQSQMNAPEVTPEPVADQPEEKETKRILLWWHYAAAAVVLLFIAVGIIKNGINLGGKTTPELAVNAPKEVPAVTEKITEVPVRVAEKNATPDKAIASVKTPEMKAETSPENGNKKAIKTAPVRNSEPQLANVTRKAKTEKTVGSEPEKLPVTEQKPVQPEETMLAINTPAPKETKEVKNSGLAGMAIEVIVKKANPENALAVNVAAEPEEEDRDSKLVSIFKQARNLKNGEKVDLQALGVNTESKLAMGTRTIHQKVNKVLDI